jgi:hypothetical protein
LAYNSFSSLWRVSRLCEALLDACGGLSALCEALIPWHPEYRWLKTAVLGQRYSALRKIAPHTTQIDLRSTLLTPHITHIQWLREEYSGCPAEVAVGRR